MRIYKRK